MKYKAKFNLASKYYRKDYKMSCTDTILKEGEYESKDFGSDQGVFVFIPFTDTRFFEPIKTRTFQVEVSEEHMYRFDALINDRFEPWTVTEITEPILPFWVIEFTSGHTDTSIKSFEGIDPAWLVTEFKGQKLYAVKWVKDHTSAWLKDCKDLVDYIFDTFN